VWFDPRFGWTTDGANIKQESDWFDMYARLDTER
jgi:hypothetical protein